MKSSQTIKMSSKRKRNMEFLLRAIFILATIVGTTQGQGNTQLGVDCTASPDDCNNFLLDALQIYCQANPTQCAGISIKVSDMNECSFNHGSEDGHDCDPSFAECVNTEGSYHCVCMSGYSDPFESDISKSGVNCTDINECDGGENPCAPDHSICTNEIGSYSCACEVGYDGNASVLCSDVDECATSSCPDEGSCINTRGSFMCQCLDGFLYNSTINTCDNINECEENPCVSPANCIDNNGGFECVCPDGESCTDDPCGVDTDCSTGADCIPVTNGYTCQCRDGYTGNARGSICDDIDECETKQFNCHGRADCVNTNGSYECVCSEGFTGNGISCSDVDECSGASPLTCWANSVCTNTYGSASCECKEGFKLASNGSFCEDIDECANVECGAYGSCINDIGGYRCVCNDGYSGEPCSDINECNAKPGPCPNNTQCRDNQGSYTCVCDFGYEGEGTNCTDIDECDNAECLNGGTCVNLDGSFRCECAQGYSGTPCENIDECENSPCSVDAVCTDTDGSHSCTCNEGFSGDGFNCTEISCGTLTCDENEVCNPDTLACMCKTGYNGSPCVDDDECTTSPCASNATCKNNGGSFSCQCNTGFTGDGMTSCTVFTCENGTVIVGNECKGVTKLWGRVTVNGFVYTTTLQDTSSNDYADMMAQTESIFTAVFAATNVTLQTIENVIFTPGSVVITAKLGVDADEAAIKSVNQILAEANDAIGIGTVALPQGVSLSHMLLEDDNQGSNSLVLECPSNKTDVCAVYAAELLNEVCPSNSTENLEICKSVAIDINECDVGFGGKFGHNCILEFAECHNTVDGFTCQCKSGFIGNGLDNTGTNCTDIDECEGGNKKVELCGMLSRDCVNTNGSYECECFDGFSGNPCSDINECLDDPCTNAICDNTDGSYSCVCFAGYALVDQHHCIDIDECDGTSLCGSYGTCQNLNGSYECICNNGFFDNNGTCEDIDECASNPCDVNAKCLNKVGDYSCDCADGFTGLGIGLGSCIDSNECNGENGGHTCHESFAMCRNEDGGFSCACKPGFRELNQTNPGRECMDIDECLSFPCGLEFTFCENTNGSFTCLCNSGYTGEAASSSCVDINECDSSPCSDVGNCTNRPGSYFCSCPEGYRKQGDTCENIDECANRPCTEPAVCNDTNGSFECNCPQNSSCGGDPCSDTTTNNCSTNAICTSVDSGYTCHCSAGYTGSSHNSECQNLDECQEKTDNCDPHADCNNTDGSFTCTCRPGYVGNGISCTDIDECENNNHTCPFNETCLDLPGSVKCVCNVGLVRFIADGPCEDVDECQQRTHDCNTNTSECMNSFASFYCYCKDGYLDLEPTNPGRNCSLAETTAIPPFTTPTTTTEGNCTMVPLPPMCPPPPLFEEEQVLLIPPPPLVPPPVFDLEIEVVVFPPPPMLPPPFFDLQEIDEVGVIPPPPPMLPPPFFDLQEIDEVNVTPPPPPILPPPFFDVEELERVSIPPPPIMPPPLPPLDIEFENDVVPPPPVFPPPLPPLDLDILEDVPPPPPMLPPLPPLILEDQEKASPPPMLPPPPPPIFMDSVNEENLPPPLILPPLPPLFLFMQDMSMPPPPPMMPPPPPFSSFEGGEKPTVRPPPPLIPPPPFPELSKKKPPPPPPMIIPPPEMPECPNASVPLNCSSGFELDSSKGLCVDINECNLQNKCNTMQKCVNTKGSYECSCIDGYRDVDGVCTELCGTFVCHARAICTTEDSNAGNGTNIQACRCPPGSFGDGTTWCIDFNECTGAEGGINLVVSVVGWNSVAGVTKDSCGDNCTAEYNGTETQLRPSNCNQNARCINKFASFECQCNDGYFGDGIICSLTSPCEDATCPEKSMCVVDGASHQCVCGTGLKLEMDSCVDIHECDSDPCPESESCTEIVGSYKCECLEGFEGEICTDIPECKRNTHNCSENEQCIERPGGYDCRCKEGYNFSAETSGCADIDECEKDTLCAENYQCENLLGSFECVCNGKFKVIDGNCVATDPCVGSSPCLPEASCVVVNDETVCICPIGFTGDGKTDCSDIPECAKNPCSESADCTETSGSFNCFCHDGYRGDGVLCTDINECLESIDNCRDNETCENEQGTFSCPCKPGYHQQTGDCVDVNECDASDVCGINYQCHNSAGSYLCICSEGYKEVNDECLLVEPCSNDPCVTMAACFVMDSEIRCECPRGYAGDGIRSCTDVNECANRPCSRFASCNNTEGSFSCRCDQNYLGDGLNCRFDSCSSSPCPDNNDCMMEESGAVTCSCKEGFVGEPCQPVTPCYPDPCGEFGQCQIVNEDSYNCNCHAGYEDNGIGCENINECAGNFECVPDSVCHDTEGSYICACKDGFQESNGNCKDINECLDGNQVCGDHSQCINRDGGYDCSCTCGYTDLGGGDKPGSDCDFDECLYGEHNCTHTCINTRNGYACGCDDGFDLQNDHTTCLPSIPCDINICSSFATCYSDSLHRKLCRCNDGFVPLGIDTRICFKPTPCAGENHCEWGCSMDLSSFPTIKEKCMCKPGYITSPWSSKCCVIETCTAATCNGHGECVTDQELGDIACRCYNGYTGDRCEIAEDCTRLDRCGFGQCNNLEGGGFNCTCFNGYTGVTNCEDIDECAADETLCLGPGQVCVNKEPGYRCECGPGYRLPDDMDEPQDGSVCYEVTHLPFRIATDTTYVLSENPRGDEVIANGTFSTGVYFQDLSYSRYYILTNGAIVLERGPVSRNSVYRSIPIPNGGRIDHAMIAPFLGDFDHRALQSRIYVSQSTWKSGASKSDIQRLANITNLVRQNFESATEFEAMESLVVTWYKVIATVGRNPDITKKDDTFQLVLATNGKESFVIFNYRIGEMGARHGVRLADMEPIIGLASTSGYSFTQSIDQPRRPDLISNIEMPGRLVYKLGESPDVGFNVDAYCRDWYNRQPTLQASTSCPPSFLQLFLNSQSYGRLLYVDYPLFPRTNIFSDALNQSVVDEMTDFAGSNCFASTKSASDGSGTICCYSSDGGIRAPLLEGGYNVNPLVMGGQVVRYLVDSDNVETAMNFLVEDVQARAICCQDEELCALYKEKRPSTTSLGYDTPVAKVCKTFAEPWLDTVDGISFSFSGMGEYIFATSPDITLQGRFTQSTDADGNLIQGTILTAVAIESPSLNHLKTEFRLVNGDPDADVLNMSISIGGSRITEEQRNALRNGDLVSLPTGMLATNNGGIQLILLNSIIMTVIPGSKFLSLSLALPKTQLGTMRGLYGLYDGNSSNDFELRSGEILPLPSIQFVKFDPTNGAKEKRMNEFLPSGTILEENIFSFGQSWLVMENETLFTYGVNESWASMRNESFIPTFLPQLLEEATEAQLNLSRTMCKNSDETFMLSCVRTYLITKDSSLAAQVVETEENLKSEEESLTNLPPVWNTEISEIRLKVGVPFTLQISANDTTTVTYNLRGTVSNGTNAMINSTSGWFSWTPADFTSYSVIFVAVDAGGLETRKGVAVKICDCHNAGNCNYDIPLTAAADTNNFQTFGCSCSAAYTGEKCTDDKDECVTNPCNGGDCIDEVAPKTGYTCNITCDVGQTLIDNKCYVQDYCNDTETAHGCEQICESTADGAVCSCLSGYELNKTDSRTCDDVDECMTTPCTALNTQCVNSVGSYKCECLDGYVGNATFECIDVNECMDGTFNCNEITEDCKNIEKSYMCVCKSGFTTSSGSCVDVDECKDEISNDCTTLLETCVNTFGSFSCICSDGFEENGVECVDTNECNGDHNCPDNSECQNELGSFTCACVSGYAYNKAKNTCEDIDECAANDGKGDCDTTCTNNQGSFQCSCSSGYSLNSDKTTCSDIDECNNPSICSQNCTNLPGSYNCSCFDGFNTNPDGSCAVASTCTDANTLECVNAVCYRNASGTANCLCNPGYQAVNSIHCEDILECSVSDKCGSNGDCTELPGSYKCSCKALFADDSGSGDPTVVTCTAVAPPAVNKIQDSQIGTDFIYITWTRPIVTEEIRVTVAIEDGTGTPTAMNYTFMPNQTMFNFTGLKHDSSYAITFQNVYKGVESTEVVLKVATEVLLNPPILEISNSTVTNESIEISWTAPTAGKCTAVKIYYTLPGTSEMVSRSSTESSISIPSLSAATNYEFQAACTHESVESSLSNKISQFTRPNAPSNLRATTDNSLAHDSLPIAWDAPTPAPDEYEAEFFPSGPVFTLDSTSATSAVISSIQLDTSIQVTLYALNKGLRSIGTSINVTVATTTTATQPISATETTTTAASIVSTTLSSAISSSTIDSSIAPNTATSTGAINISTSTTSAATDATESSTLEQSTTAATASPSTSTTTESPSTAPTTSVVVDTASAGTTSEVVTATASSMASTTTTATSTAASTSSTTATSMLPPASSASTVVVDTASAGTASEVVPTTASGMASTTTTSISTDASTSSTTEATCGSLQVSYQGQCQGYTTRILSMRFTQTVVYTSDLANPSSLQYLEMVKKFEPVVIKLFAQINIIVYSATFTFRNGSVIGDANVQLPDSEEGDSAALTRRINNAIKESTDDDIVQYGISNTTIEDFDECSNQADNCHSNANCTNADPGFTCTCLPGHREKNRTSPGTLCEPQCEFNGEPYCKNGGMCTEGMDSQDPSCGCTTFFQGKRCSETNGGAVAGVVLGVLGGILLIVLVTIAIVHYHKKKNFKQRLTGNDESRKRYDEVSAGGSTNGSFRYNERNLDDMLA